MSENGSGSQNVFIHPSFFDNSSLNHVFLCFVVESLHRQLNRINKTDKSLSSFDSFYKLSGRKYVKPILQHGSSLSILIFLSLLLLTQGIESNPGPFHAYSSATKSRAGITITTQNCRGLTDPAKLISLLRKAYSNPKQGNILCLQETHQLNRFALDNHFKGDSVVDNGERDQRGTAILVSEQFKICMSRISGDGRWALAAIRDQTMTPQLAIARL